MPALKPKRDHLPVTTGKLPSWDLAEVEDTYLVAELVRRNYYGGTAAAPTRPCCGQPVKATQPHKAGCKVEADQKARQATAIKAADDQRKRLAAEEAERQRQAKIDEARRREAIMTPAEKREAKAPVVPVPPARKQLSL